MAAEKGEKNRIVTVGSRSVVCFKIDYDYEISIVRFLKK